MILSHTTFYSSSIPKHGGPYQRPLNPTTFIILRVPPQSQTPLNPKFPSNPSISKTPQSQTPPKPLNSKHPSIPNTSQSQTPLNLKRPLNPKHSSIPNTPHTPSIQTPLNLKHPSNPSIPKHSYVQGNSPLSWTMRKMSSGKALSL